MTEEEKAVEALAKEVADADKYGWQSFRVPKERIRTLLTAYERRDETLVKIATFQRGGVVVHGTPAGDRDEMIGVARTALPREAWWNKLAALNQETHHG